MHVLIIWGVWIYVKLWWWCSQIPFREEVEWGIIVEEDPDTDVKFPLIDQEGLLYVLLQDKAIVFDLILRELSLLWLSLKLGGCNLIIVIFITFVIGAALHILFGIRGWAVLLTIGKFLYFLRWRTANIRLLWNVACRLHRRIRFAPALAIPLYQLFKLCEVIDNMNTTATVQFCGLQ